MAATVGYGGQVRVSSSVVLNIKEWSADLQAADLDQTVLGSGWEKHRAGIRGGKGKIAALLDTADTNGQIALQNAFLNATAVTLNLDTAASGSNRTYSGSAYLLKQGISTKVDDSVTAEWEFVFDGAVTFA